MKTETLLNNMKSGDEKLISGLKEEIQKLRETNKSIIEISKRIYNFFKK